MPKTIEGRKEKQPSRLFQYCIHFKGAFFIIIAVSAISAFMQLLVPDWMGRMTDIIAKGIAGNIDMRAMKTTAIVLAVIYLINILMTFVQNFVTVTISQKVTQTLRSDSVHKLNRLPLGYFHKNTVGEVLSKITNDTSTLGQGLNQSIGNLASAISLFIGCLVMMFRSNVIMSIVTIVTTIVGFAFTAVITGNSQKYFDRQQEYLGKINGHVEEAFSGHLTVKAYNHAGYMKERFSKYNRALRESMYKAQFFSGLMMPLMLFMGNIGYAAVCIIGAVLVIKGEISFGLVISFTMYVKLFTQPLSQIAQAVQSMQSAVASGRRIFNLMDEEEMKKEVNTKDCLKAEGNVCFRNVRFQYDDSEHAVIKDFSLQVKKGQKVAIVGPTGAGKTTLIKLLMRFYEITAGDILLDDVSIYDLARADVHEQFCMVPQDTWLFEDTIRRNLIYTEENISEEELDNVCKAVGIYHFIQSLPEKYNTVLNEQLSLSVGQKQQLTIARAMIKNAPILILDEATSSVDTKTELWIQKAMDRLMSGRTSFVIAHRLSTIKNADVVLVLQDGDIVESGTHTSLMERRGIYAELYNSQFEAAI